MTSNDIVQSNRPSCEPPELVQTRNNRHIVQSKELRVKLDATLTELHTACRDRRSRERSIAITKLQEAIMWLGMDLKDIGAPTPYPNSYNPANTIVDKTADNLKF